MGSDDDHGKCWNQGLKNKEGKMQLEKCQGEHKGGNNCDLTRKMEDIIENPEEIEQTIEYNQQTVQMEETRTNLDDLRSKWSRSGPLNNCFQVRDQYVDGCFGRDRPQLLHNRQHRYQSRGEKLETGLLRQQTSLPPTRFNQLPTPFRVGVTSPHQRQRSS